MLKLGIDVGSENTQVVVVDDSEIIGRGTAKTGFDQNKAVEDAKKQALEDAGVDEDEIELVGATGEGRESVENADRVATSVGAAAKGAYAIRPDVKTVLQMGAKIANAITVEEGKAVDFDENDKCAAGVGQFVDTLTRYLDAPRTEIISGAINADETVEMNAQCAVFAESETISLIHKGVQKDKIAKAVHEAVADRNASLVERVGIKGDEVMVVGGMGLNDAFLKSLEEALGKKVSAPEDPEYIPALGAALMAEE